MPEEVSFSPGYRAVELTGKRRGVASVSFGPPQANTEVWADFDGVPFADFDNELFKDFS